MPSAGDIFLIKDLPPLDAPGAAPDWSVRDINWGTLTGLVCRDLLEDVRSDLTSSPRFTGLSGSLNSLGGHGATPTSPRFGSLGMGGMGAFAGLSSLGGMGGVPLVRSLSGKSMSGLSSHGNGPSMSGGNGNGLSMSGGVSVTGGVSCMAGLSAKESQTCLQSQSQTTTALAHSQLDAIRMIIGA